ncbi:MAG TPA: alanine--glyoxylate aminotransferase family protein [Blastocatellia bacterium]|nr:alanine--glyoxylate aminotransferase family protein [Blastocatellia bacterium]
MAETRQRSKERPNYETFNPPKRILLGPGPSPVDQQVLTAMAAPVIGHLDPAFLQCMDDIKAMLRYAFDTENGMTLPISGTGSAGMEASIVNLVEPGDEVVACIGGYFGERMHEMAERAGAKTVPVRAEWGKSIDRAQIEDAIRSCKPKVVAIVSAETSTGVWQDLAGLGDLVHSQGALLVVDAVTALGTQPIHVDAMGIDVCFSCSQKGIGAPPGLSPITFSDRAMKAITGRQRKVQSWYLDVTTIQQYWGANRSYHHTAPISMNYALREALRLLCAEGMEPRWRRHELNSRAFVAAVDAMGLEMLVTPKDRLWGVNVVRVPESVDDAGVRSHLLDEASIEISGGLGPFKGRVWRIGLMGAGSTEQNVKLLVGALHKALAAQGFDRGPGLEAAEKVYAAAKAS